MQHEVGECSKQSEIEREENSNSNCNGDVFNLEHGHMVSYTVKSEFLVIYMSNFFSFIL